MQQRDFSLQGLQLSRAAGDVAAVLLPEVLSCLVGLAQCCCQPLLTAGQAIKTAAVCFGSGYDSHVA